MGFWKSAEDLHGKVSIALMKAFNTGPRTGWVRATPAIGNEVMQELSRLSKENADLRAQIEITAVQSDLDRKRHLHSRIQMLKDIPWTLNLREKKKATWDIKVDTDLFDLFSDLSIEMMVEISVADASLYLAVVKNPDATVELSDEWPIGQNNVSEIFAGLSAFDLVEPSKKKHAVSDKSVYWSLTSEGMELLKLDRMTELEARAARRKLSKKI